MMFFQDYMHRWHGLGGPVSGAAGAASERLDDAQRLRQILTWSAVAALAAVVTGQAARQWMAHAAANVCILGGIVGAPIISVVAWVGMVLPTKAPLHQAAPTLMLGALIWLGLAIVGAHAFRLDRSGAGGEDAK
jgi:hypothetical protein